MIRTFKTTKIDPLIHESVFKSSSRLNWHGIPSEAGKARCLSNSIVDLNKRQAFDLAVVIYTC